MQVERPVNALPDDHALHWYRIHEVLGVGGFGITYRATDLNLDQHVAIKEYLPCEFACRSEDGTIGPTSAANKGIFDWGLKRFIDEARTLSRFSHPNIVGVISVFEAENTAYMVMNYEDGEDLGHAIKADKFRSEENLLALVLPLLDGLTAVHAKGFIHRDIKPSNIYIRADGTPVLLDFGSARHAMSGKSRTLTGIVSPGYSPFEQYNDSGAKQGPYTDIYGLAATLYRAVTGRVPPDAIQRAGAIAEKSDDPLIPARKLCNGQFTDHFLSAIDDALSFHIEQRPRDCAEWRLQLNGEVREDKSSLAVTVVEDDGPEAETNTSVTDIAPTGQDRSSPSTYFPPLSQGSPELKRPFPAAPLVLGITILVLLGYAGFTNSPQSPSPTAPNQPSPSFPSPEERESEIQELMEKADVLVTPHATEQDLETAIGHYSAVLDLAPKHPEASESLFAAKRDYARLIQRDQAITRSLNAADRAMTAGHYVNPPGASARSHYSRVLEIEPGNVRATEGMNRIVEHITRSAENSYNQGRLEEATESVNQGLSIEPNNPELLSLRHQLAPERPPPSEAETNLPANKPQPDKPSWEEVERKGLEHVIRHLDRTQPRSSGTR
ncbi:MAG: protein kinase domain-containing protein [Gammaproteobacteria bacterium]